ncbi:hypothetical protein QCA50_020128 [Cerrena zonata]|uniref:F-box domain-containing protein n=1 Tax=Cerrena zonata TaxID=2478898 RepID=A0AAW0FI69_9APHY
MPTTDCHSDNAKSKGSQSEEIPVPTSVLPLTIAPPSLKRRASEADLDLSLTVKRARLTYTNDDAHDGSSASDTTKAFITDHASSRSDKQCSECIGPGDQPGTIDTSISITPIQVSTVSGTLLVDVPGEEQPSTKAVETHHKQVNIQSSELLPSDLPECKDRSLVNSPPLPEIACKSPIKVTPTTSEQQTTKPLLLPLELHDLILNCFWDDTNVSSGPVGYHVIRNCIKVCSRWYAAARPHFFREVTVLNPKRLNGLISLVRDDPNIATWIRKIKLHGVTEPLRPFGERQPDNVEKDHDNWLYKFPLCFDVPLPNLRKIELNQFAHVSRRREDCEAFARWIPGLATLKSVEILSVYQSEMSSNSFAAIARAFPRLTNVDFTFVNFLRPNIGVLVDKSFIPAKVDPPSSPIVPSEAESLSEDPSLNHCPVEYPLLHPLPSLQSFDAKNAEGKLFYFNVLRDWISPKTLAQSLHTMILGYQVDLKSVATLLSDLGASPKLEHLQLHVGWYRDFFVECNVDISRLTNLKDLVLLSDRTSTTEISLNCRQLLSQVATTQLKSITLIVYYDRKYIKKQLAGIDADLSEEKFNKLEAVHVKLINTAWTTDTPQKRRRLVREIRPKIKKLLPLTNKRGILEISPWYG